MSTSTNGKTQTALYDELLTSYWNALNESEFHPYASFQKQLINVFRPRYWNFISHSAKQFIRIPNALKQELIDVESMLKIMEALPRGQIDSIEIMNEINLSRLQRRSIVGGIAKYSRLYALVISIVVALIKFILDDINPLMADTMSCIIALVLMYLVLTCAVNFLLIAPRIGLVRAFGDIVRIEQVRRQSNDSRRKPHRLAH